MKQPKYMLYTKHAWQNGLAALSSHDSKEQAQQAALALIRQSNPRILSPVNLSLTIVNAHLKDELNKLATDYVIAYGIGGTGREYGLPSCPAGWSEVTG